MKVELADEQGPVDVCAKHGGVETRCVVHGCTRLAQGKGETRSDDLGESGPRCRRHMEGTLLAK